MGNSFRRTKKIDGSSKYGIYGFNQNPFPVDPTVKPYSEDRRENGSIFLTELREKELEEFKSSIITRGSKISFMMDYAAYKGRGIGKTAFMNYVKNIINNDLGDEISEGNEILYAVYVSPSPDKRERSMSMIVKKIFESMLQSDLFMVVFARMRAFSDMIPDEILEKVGRPDTYKDTICNDTWLVNEGVDVVKLNAYVWKQLSEIGIDLEASSLFPDWEVEDNGSYNMLYNYLKRFVQSEYTWKNEGNRLFFDILIRLFQKADITHCVILLDEVEKIVTYQNFSERRLFCDNLRNYFIDGESVNAISGFYRLLMTIHPNSQELLKPHWHSAGMDRFSELGGISAKGNTIFFQPIENSGEIAKKLTLIYMNEAQKDRDPQSFAPFTEAALNKIMEKAENVPGRFLKYLYNAIEQGVENNWKIIDAQEVESMWISSNEVKPEKKEIKTLPEAEVSL